MDELRRVRELTRGVPDPDPRCKSQARRELLQLAEEEASAPQPTPQPASPRTERRTGWLERLRERWLRPVPAAGLAATALVAVVGAGVLLSEPEAGPPPELADPGASEEAEPGEVETLSDDDAITLAASCTDPDGGHTVAYPDDWFTPQEGEPGACRFFGEDAFDVDAAVGGQPVADLEVRVEAVTVETLLDDELGLEETERERVDRDGGTVVRQRLATTGEGALPDDVWVERYLVELGDGTAILTVQDDDETVLDERRELLEEMARSLRSSDGPSDPS